MQRSFRTADRMRLMHQIAPDLAMSGKFEDASEVVEQLFLEGYDVGRIFSKEALIWLNELCDQARAVQSESLCEMRFSQKSRPGGNPSGSGRG